MHILVIDHSVIAYKAFMRLFSQTYEGETNDELHEFTRQYVSEIVYLLELHKPDGVLFAVDCPREDIWRHRVVRRFYGPKMNVHPVEWYPGTEVRTAETACRWYVECHNSFKELYLDADGSYVAKHMTKSKFTPWAKEEAEKEGPIAVVKDRAILKKMLPKVAKMYKGNREGNHFPASAVIPRTQFKDIALKLMRKIAPSFGARVVGAPELEADDIAYAAVKRWFKHDITVATIDKDWTQLGLHMEKLSKEAGIPPGKFRFWDVNKYEFLDTATPKMQRMFFEKLLTGDSSDNIESARLKGQTSGIGPKKCDKLFDEVPIVNMYEWLKEHGNTDTLMRNATLMNLCRVPEDLGKRALEALLESSSQLTAAPEVPLEKLASEATLNLARIDGQKAHMKHVLMKESTDGGEET